MSCPWKEAIIDALVVEWVLTAENQNDPRRAINDLLCNAARQALDPAISQPAHDLHEKIRELEASVASLRAEMAEMKEAHHWDLKDALERYDGRD